MRHPLFLPSALALVTAIGAPSYAGTPRDLHPSRHVDPFIGTDDSNSPHPVPGGAGGSTFPGAVAPFGMIQWGPDTPTASPSGYRHRDTKIEGFSVTHFNGAGCPNNEDLPILPVVGPLTESPGTAWSRHVSRFSHDSEKAQPGYYAVTLTDPGVAVELAVTTRAGLARFHYPATPQATVLVDASHHATGAHPGAVEIVGPDRLGGYVTAGNFCNSAGTFRLYYAIRFDRPFASFGTWDDKGLHAGSETSRGKPAGAYLVFDTSTQRQVQMKIGLSYVSVGNAQLNLESELPRWDLAAVRKRITADWDRLLARVQAGGTPEQQRTLYTALYHTLVNPNVASDVNGQWMGYDDVVHESRHIVYQNYSGWDVYRSWIQLASVVAPEITRDILSSMVEAGAQLGHLPKWTHQNREANVMNGDPGTLIVANGHAFGVRDFDARSALTIMHRSGSEVARGAREKVAAYLRHGYLPDDPSTTLEETAADFAVAQLARALGDAPLFNAYATRAQYWQNTFNAATGYMQARAPDGSWRPLDLKNDQVFVEGNAAQYTWMVPYNLRGLFDRLGGDKVAVTRLDELFRELNAGTNRPHFYMGNEPQFATPWAYNFAGAPWKTQEVVRRIVTESFNAGTGGLPGNDDLGATSSWLVWAMLGLYPAVPGTDLLVMHGPMLPAAEVQVGRRRFVHIAATGAGGYVQGLAVNGKATTRSWLRWSDLAGGATLAFTMGSAPNTRWGSARADLPPSFGEAGVNAALHKPAIGSKPCTAATGPDKAVDGSLAGEDNKWCSDEPHPFLQVDLGVELPVTGFLVKHAGVRGGSTSDKWCSHGKNAWLQVDLGATAPLEKVVLKHAGAGGESTAWNTRDFLVQGSLDGKAWSKLLDVTGNTASVTTHPLAAVPARYLRLDVVTPTSNTNKSTRIYELEAYDHQGHNLARGRPATADGVCNPRETPENAFDGGDEPTRNTRDFDIQLSPDAQQWTKVVEVTGNTASQTSHPIAATPARYVRLDVITPTSDGTSTTRIYELEVSTATTSLASSR